MEMNASVKIRPRWQVNMHMIQERRTRLDMKNGIHMIITAYPTMNVLYNMNVEI